MSTASAFLATLAATLVLTPPASAQSAVFDASQACYRTGQPVVLSGYGFTPSTGVALSVDGQQLTVGSADARGVFVARLRAPWLPFPVAGMRFTATDQAQLLNRATALVRLTRLDVYVTPAGGSPSRPRRIRAQGFFEGRVLYAHTRHRGHTRTVRLGRLRGPCHVFDARRRIFPLGIRPGAYRLHFDTTRRFRPGARARRVTYAVRIAPSRHGRRATYSAISR